MAAAGSTAGGGAAGGARAGAGAKGGEGIGHSITHSLEVLEHTCRAIVSAATPSTFSPSSMAKSPTTSPVMSSSSVMSASRSAPSIVVKGEIERERKEREGKIGREEKIEAVREAAKYLVGYRIPNTEKGRREFAALLQVSGESREK